MKMKDSITSCHDDSQPKDQSMVVHIVPSETIQTTGLSMKEDLLFEKDEDDTSHVSKSNFVEGQENELSSCEQEEHYKSFDSYSISSSLTSLDNIEFSEAPDMPKDLWEENKLKLDDQVSKNEATLSQASDKIHPRSIENKSKKHSSSSVSTSAPASLNSVPSLSTNSTSISMYYGSNPYYPIQIIPFIDNPYPAHPVQCAPFQPMSSSSLPFASHPPDPKDAMSSSYQEGKYLADFRVLILSNLPSEYKIADLLSQIHAGPLERVQQKLEKNKVILSFLYAEDAIKFHEYYNRRRFQFQNRSLKVTFARPCRLAESVFNVCNNMAASRNVFIGNLPSSFGERELLGHFGKFGEIESVKILSRKNIAFIHYLNIKDAIRVVQTLSSDPVYHAWRIFYGTDRCEHRGTGTYSPAYGSPKPSSSSLSISSDPEVKESTTTTATTEISQKPATENRTVFLGNLDAKVKGSEICDLIHCGPLQDFHYIPEKHICFVTFVDVADAKAFHSYISNETVVLHGRRIKSGWGKESGSLPRVLETSISMGASRNVYFSKVTDSLTKKELELILRQYGEIESIKYLKQPNTGFVSYTNISNGMKAFHGLPLQPAFQKSRIQYARDRCDKSDSYLSSPTNNSPSLNTVQTQQPILPSAVPFTIPMYPPIFTAPSNIKQDTNSSTYAPPFAPYTNMYGSIPPYQAQQSAQMQHPK